MLTEITAALSSLKAASDILKGFNSLKLETAVKEKSLELSNIIIELQFHILSLQSEYSNILESKADIEKELQELKNWDRTKKEYTLDEIAPGVLAYTNKKQSTSPKHWLCANCFDIRNQKSILQRKIPGLNHLICHSCSSTLKVSDDEANTQQITFRP